MDEGAVLKVVEWWLSANLPAFLSAYVFFLTGSAAVLYHGIKHGGPSDSAEAVIYTVATLVFLFCLYTVLVGYTEARRTCQDRSSVWRNANNCDSMIMKW